MKKRHRFSLTFAILLPVIGLIALAEVGLYAGAYFVLRDSAYQSYVASDIEDINDIIAQLQDPDDPTQYTALGYAAAPVIRAYEENKPATMLKPGSQEEADYQELISKSAASMVYANVEQKLQRFITTFFGIFYEDVAANRMVLVCSSDRRQDYETPRTTSLYLGAFFEKTDVFLNSQFTGERITDRLLGPMFASGVYLGEISHPTEHYGQYKVWIIRETTESKVYSSLPIFSRSFAIVASIVLVAIVAITYVILTFVLIRPTKRHSKAGNTYVESLKKGKNEIQFAPSTGVSNEVTDINDALYYIQGAIADYEKQVVDAAAYEGRIRADLALAEQIQAGMVPTAPLIEEGYALHGFMRPAKEVGGDLYNYVKLDDDHVGFFIGDVSGKGVPAALFMAKANTVLRLVSSNLDFDAANKTLAENNAALLFVTAFMGVLQVSTGKLRYVNAGHEPVFVRHNGVYSALGQNSNFALGVDETFEYEVQETTLVKGDGLFLYTDGISEAMNEAGELFGHQRILDALNTASNLPSHATLLSLINTVEEFVGGAEQSDDACCVVLDYSRESVLRFPPTIEGLAQVEPFTKKFMEGMDPELTANIQVVLDELCSNVVFYSGAKEEVVLTLCDEGTNISGAVFDKGEAFNPLGERPEKDPEYLGGRGIIMAKAMTDSLVYFRHQNANLVCFRKKIED